MANLFEIDMTLKDIDARPEEHDQLAWAQRKISQSGAECGTSMCAAGFTVARHGYTLIFNSAGVAFNCLSPTGEVEEIAEAARRILELTPLEANAFFAGYNTREDLDIIRDYLAAAMGEK